MAILSRGSFRGPRPIRSPRRKTTWALGPGGTVGGQVLSASSSVIVGSGAAATLDGITVARLRGELLLTLLTSSLAGGGFEGAFGIARFTEAAFAAGVASLQHPIDEESWDGWMYHQYFALSSGGVISGAASKSDDAVSSVSAVLRVMVDSKAMRKFEINDVMAGVLQIAETGTASMLVQFRSRQLVMLP